MRNSLRSICWSIVVSARNGGPAEIGEAKSGKCLFIEYGCLLISITWEYVMN